MKTLTIAILILLTGTFATCFAQDSKEFHDYANKEKSLMLKAYAKHDIAGYRKNLNDFLARYNKLNDKEKKNFKWYVDEDYYILADLYALAGDKKNALACLEKSKNYDYNDLVRDHDLDNVRKDPQFVKLLKSLKNPKSKYLLTLQQAPKYNNNEENKLPAFTYQSPDDANLAALKNTYHLDSIAGKGNDISQIINLMEWVHYLIPHDGSKGNPKIKNALSFISECRQNNKTLNCRGLAIILNEVYLAEGFKSRFVTCLPKDTADQDCHVITIVWSASLKKWVWMDPTFMAYVMNENGELLSIEEVRDRLINNKPLILNPDANRNHATSQTKSDYLGYYMAKNLYKLECPVNSQYNYETPEEGKARAYVQLLPGNATPPTETDHNKHGITTYTLYYTNNPKTFWAAPPAGITPAIVTHTQADYEHVLEKFKNCYNNNEADSICNMFSDDWGERKKSMWSEEINNNLMADYGKIISYKYMAMDDGDGDNDVALFKIVCEKSVHVMGISLDKNNKIGTSRPETSSPYIDKLLAKEE